MRDGTDTAPDSQGANDRVKPEVVSTIGSDLIDFGASHFHGDLVGEKVEHHYHGATGSRALQSLPAQTGGFVGRHDELCSLLRVLDPGASSQGTVLISAVAGLGGVGKTALALRAAHAAQQSGLFPAGVVFLDLHGYDDAPVTSEQALEHLLRALGVLPDHIPASADARAGLYRSELAALATQRGSLLIVADNASQASQVRPLLPGHPRHRVLVTSRDTLSQLGAQVLHLGVLPMDVAVEALRTALTTANPSDTRIEQEPGQAQRLSSLCGGLPLALHIAAALLVIDPAKPIEELADDLADAATRIDHLDDGERAMRAAFDMSYRRLSGEAARLFRLLALAPGPEAGMEALSALAGSVPSPRDLHILVRAHLIEAGSSRGRWRMHDLVRAYAVAKTRENVTHSTDGQAARARLIERYHARAADSHAYLKPVTGQALRSGFADRREALAWLDGERSGLVAAAQWAAEPAHAEAGTQYALSLCHYLGWRRHFDDAATVYGHAVEGARLLGDRYLEGMAQDNFGIALRYLRRLNDAIEAHQRALRIFRELGSPLGEGKAEYNLGNALLSARRFDVAVGAFESANTLLRASGAEHTAAMAQNGLGTVHLRTGRFSEALERISQAQDVFRSIGDTYLEAVATNNRGRAQRCLERFDAACEDHARAIHLFGLLGHEEAEATARNDLALTLLGMGRVAEAVAHHAEALRSFRQQREQYREALVLNDLGVALSSEDNHQGAVKCHERALSLFREVFADIHGQARSLELLAAATSALGRAEQAERARREALRLRRTVAGG